MGPVTDLFFSPEKNKLINITVLFGARLFWSREKPLIMYWKCWLGGRSEFQVFVCNNWIGSWSVSQKSNAFDFFGTGVGCSFCILLAIKGFETWFFRKSKSLKFEPDLGLKQGNRYDSPFFCFAFASASFCFFNCSEISFEICLQATNYLYRLLVVRFVPRHLESSATHCTCQ